jgi:hypothetical protein
MALIEEPSPFEEEIEQLPAEIPSARIDPDRLWNLGTLVVLLCLVILVAVFALIFVNPQAVVNPYPPPTMPVALLLPSSTPTPPLPTAEPTQPPTATPSPTETPLPAPRPPPASVRLWSNRPHRMPMRPMPTI